MAHMSVLIDLAMFVLLTHFIALVRRLRMRSLLRSPNVPMLSQASDGRWTYELGPCTYTI